MNVTGRTTWSRGGLVAVPRCPMCGSAERTFVAETTDAMTGRADPWSLWSCRACRSEWLDPRPDDASLPAAYDFDYVTHREATVPDRGGMVRAAINAYLRRRHGMQAEPRSAVGGWLLACLPPLRLKLDYYARHLGRGQGRSLLDIGSGNGAFLEVATRMGWRAEGVDPDPAAVSLCREKGLVVTHGFLGDVDPERSQWDAITLSHSLEHAPDPRALLDDVYGRLASGGCAWIGIPNPEARGARLFGAAWESHDVPRHLCLPSADAMLAACRAAGFADVRLMRRGMHTGRLYRRSAEISALRNGGVHRPRSLRVRLQSLLTDLLATFDARAGDELVIVATRGRGDAP